VFGHWEIDLVVGGKDTAKPPLMTRTERKTRKILIRKLADKTQQSVLNALVGIERSMGAGAFLMIRRFIAKGRDISTFGRERIWQIEEWINRYPRKILQFQTAEERYVTELAA
jgi:IS30 family transposase